MDRRKTDRRTDGLRDMYMFDLQDLMDILWRRKALIIGFMLIALIPGLMYIVTKPNMYEATAIVMMEEPDYNLADFSEAMGTAARIDESTFATQLSILVSPRLIEETLREVTKEKTITEAQIKNFYGNLTVAPVGKSRVLTIAYKSKNAEETATIVNAHVQNFIDYRLETKKQQIEVINKWLNEQVAKLKEDSQKKGQAIQEFRGESGIVLGPDAQNLIYQQISELTQQLVPLETQRILLQSKADALNADGATADLPDVMASEVVKDLKSQLSAAEQELRALSAQYGKSHPSRQAAQKRVSQIYGDLARETKSIRASINMELEAVTKQTELLNARIDELNQQADQTQNQSLTMESLQGELEANRKLLVAYMDKFQEIKTKMDLSNSDIRILNMAEVPVEPNGPGKVLQSLILLVLSVFFAIGAVLMLELVDRGIENENDVKRVLNLKLLGSLPFTKNPLNAITGKNKSPYAEEMKRIYLALSARKSPQTILVTSAANGEGKTTFALSLAQYLSSIKSRVIIVDADTDSPSLATLAGTDVAPGFAELMSGSNDYTKAVKRDGANLAVIPAGDRDRNSVDILSSNAFPQMLETLKSQYDYVILDCANAQSSTDAEVIAGQVDNVILVAQWNKTPKKALKKVAENLRQHARDIPSVILNKRA